MRNSVFIAVVIPLFLSSCGGDKDKNADTSGTATINNDLTLDPKLQTYINWGFLFSEAKLVSNVGTPKPDITIDNDGTLANLILQTGNFKNSFFKAGEYADAATASQAFDNLKAPVVPQWVSWGFGIKAHQIWIFKTSTEHYAKIRIISTISEIRSQPEPDWKWAECTFEWVYQPDGTLTFPGK